jgi:predicted nucleotidyltransferase
MQAYGTIQSRDSIQQLANELAHAASSPAKVMLFGSYARGEATAHSDVDLLILEKEFHNRGEEYLRLMNVVGARNVDLILMKEDDFQMRSDWVGSLPYYAAREGVMLHG